VKPHPPAVQFAPICDLMKFRWGFGLARALRNRGEFGAARRRTVLARMQKKAPDPPFWIRETDDSGRPLDPRVRQAAQKMWRRILQLTKSKLKDTTRAAEILEAAALAVSNRLRQSDDAPIQDLDAYLYKACVYKIGEIARDEARERGGHDLSQLEFLATANADEWQDRLFNEVLARQLLAHMDSRTRELYYCRGAGRSWQETATLFGYADGHSAEVQFWKGLKAARERVKRREAPEPESM
jgi:hypothetical protein